MFVIYGIGFMSMSIAIALLNSRRRRSDAAVQPSAADGRRNGMTPLAFSDLLTAVTPAASVLFGAFI